MTDAFIPLQTSNYCVSFQNNSAGFLSVTRSRDNLVVIALSYGLDDRRPVLGPTEPPVQGVAGALSLGVKRPRPETDYSPLSSAEVKNAWSYTSTPPIRPQGVVLTVSKMSSHANVERPMVLRTRLKCVRKANVYCRDQETNGRNICGGVTRVVKDIFVGRK
jgi:hypothetical protein